MSATPDPIPTTGAGEPVDDAPTTTSGDVDSTEPDNTTEGDDTAAEGADAPLAARLRREAARHRAAAREAQATAERLQTVVDDMHRAEVCRIATGAGFADGADGLTGLDLAAVRSEDGALSPELVAAHLDEVATAHPHWLARPTPPRSTRPREALRSSGEDDTRAPSWSTLIRGR